MSNLIVEDVSEGFQSFIKNIVTERGYKCNQYKFIQFKNIIGT